MTESRKGRKWAPSRISFVKISAGLIRDPAWDMEDFQQGILNPFTDRIFPHFHVTNLLSGHIVGPLDTRFVVIIKR